MASHESESMPNFLIFSCRLDLHSNTPTVGIYSQTARAVSNLLEKNGKNTEVDR